MASPPLPDPRPDLKPRYSTLFRAATCCLFVFLFRCCCCFCFAFVFPSVLPLSCLCLPFCVSCVVFPVVFAFVFPSVFPLSCLSLPCLRLSSLLRWQQTLCRSLQRTKPATPLIAPYCTLPIRSDLKLKMQNGSPRWKRKK